jgi:hypothetical protein
MKLLSVVLVLLLEMGGVASSDAVGKLRRHKASEKPLGRKLLSIPRYYDDYFDDDFDDTIIDDFDDNYDDNYDYHIDYFDENYDDYFENLDDMDFFYDTVLYDDGNLYDDTLNY